MTKTESILKYIPALTLLCYIIGFVVYNSFLLQYGIVDTNILNVRYIQAGILYMLFAPFVLLTSVIAQRKLNYPGSLATAIFGFIVLNSVLGNSDWNYLWKPLIAIVVLNSFSFLTTKWHKSDLDKNDFDLTEAPIQFGVLVIISLLLFSFYYKEIRNNFGGGKIYRKVLVLKEARSQILKTDSLFHSDTLQIPYENSEFIYFLNGKNVVGLKKELLIGEFLVK
jgi:hypothetical protein